MQRYPNRKIKNMICGTNSTRIFILRPKKLNLKKKRNRQINPLAFEHWQSLPMIPNAKDNPKTHVNYAKNDGNLHFIRVKVRDLIFSQHPDGIDTKRIRCLPIMTIGLVRNQHSRMMML